MNIEPTNPIHYLDNPFVSSETNEVLPDCEAYEAQCSRLRCDYGVQRTRTADGCERCACITVEVNCELLKQECRQLNCSYGKELSVGDDGCER